MSAVSQLLTMNGKPITICLDRGFPPGDFLKYKEKIEGHGGVLMSLLDANSKTIILAKTDERFDPKVTKYHIDWLLNSTTRKKLEDFTDYILSMEKRNSFERRSRTINANNENDNIPTIPSQIPNGGKQSNKNLNGRKNGSRKRKSRAPAKESRASTKKQQKTNDTPNVQSENGKTSIDQQKANDTSNSQSKSSETSTRNSQMTNSQTSSTALPQTAPQTNNSKSQLDNCILPLYSNDEPVVVKTESSETPIKNLEKEALPLKRDLHYLLKQIAGSAPQPLTRSGRGTRKWSMRLRSLSKSRDYKLPSTSSSSSSSLLCSSSEEDIQSGPKDVTKKNIPDTSNEDDVIFCGMKNGEKILENTEIKQEISTSKETTACNKTFQFVTA